MPRFHAMTPRVSPTNAVRSRGRRGAHPRFPRVHPQASLSPAARPVKVARPGTVQRRPQWPRQRRLCLLLPGDSAVRAENRGGRLGQRPQLRHRWARRGVAHDGGRGPRSRSTPLRGGQLSSRPAPCARLEGGTQASDRTARGSPPPTCSHRWTHKRVYTHVHTHAHTVGLFSVCEGRKG